MGMQGSVVSPSHSGLAGGQGRGGATAGASVAAFEGDRARWRGAPIRTKAAAYTDVLVEHGLPADFLGELDAPTTALGASVDARGVARSRVSDASSGLVSDLALGRHIVAMINASPAQALKSESCAAQRRGIRLCDNSRSAMHGYPSQARDRISGRWLLACRDLCQRFAVRRAL